MMQLRFEKQYFLLGIGLLVLEILIALYLHDKIIRPYVGDFLAPIFLYCLVRSCCMVAPRRVAAVVLLIAYLIELLQYFHFLSWLGWQHVRVANVLLGNHFEWADLLAYTAGIGLVLLVEQLRRGPASARNEWRRVAG
ncbi:ribosomal maturation YjgA family protein [Hymenobacter convexus]|uniref:ribosomal maturation YjgA family protein n=1 Tax=Hymenobacter sp. CA1UV-4 TaxID=3063782 RepID=UPI0027123FB2|nr:DUF2809 domain-containing protein [Hymenobacter sp. CA1UV-4]MDO7852078.1 DUF2809 domain-containing protein [Hymenobacter sp. CA1UV-4]